jgi:undecaprenyl-phosphate 4-deoxy-4-formamido-L-arabinose transferase
LISGIGVVSVIFSMVLCLWVIWEKFSHEVPIQGWTSLVVLVSFSMGFVLLALGVIAEYLGMAVNMALGRPLFLVVSRPTKPVNLGK